MKRMVKLLKIIAVFYAILFVAAVVFQKRITFWNKPLPPDYQYSFKHGVPFEERWYKPDSSLNINALYFKTDTSKRKGLVLYFHGNADNLARWGKYADAFTRNGYDVLMIDYPQFGKSTGELTEATLHACARYVYEEAQKDFPEDQIIVYGRSLGTGIATKLASQTNPKMLLLETPYYSLSAVGRSHLPILPYELINSVKMHTDEWIIAVKCPVHLFHGTKDELVPYDHSLRLVKLLAKNPNEILTTIPGGKHKNLGEYKVYQLALDSCLAK